MKNFSYWYNVQILKVMQRVYLGSYFLESITPQTEVEKPTNQFVEIFPNFANVNSDMKSLSGDPLYIDNNGSLVFQNTYSYHSGRYLCHVSNGIGHAIHQIVNVNVKGNHFSEENMSTN